MTFMIIIILLLPQEQQLFLCFHEVQHQQLGDEVFPLDAQTWLLSVVKM